MTDIRQTKLFAEYLSRIGWQIEKIDGIYVYIRKIPFLGKVAKVQRPNIIDPGITKKLPFKQRFFQTIIEPDESSFTKSDEGRLKTAGFKIANSSYLPSKTIHLDLSKSKMELFSELKKDTRYSLRKTKNIKIYRLDKISQFRRSWRQSAGRKRYIPSINHLNALNDVFKDNSLFVVTPDGSAGAIFLMSGNRAYYWQGFSNELARKQHAQYKIVWAGIMWTKNKGAKIFDFEGIYDERFPNKNWLGFTHFKKSFGGYEVAHPATFIKSSIPFL